MEKSKKYKGVYLDKNTNKYYVSTTFMTKDGYEVKKTKRGFETAKQANAWKEEQKVNFSKVNGDQVIKTKTPTEQLLVDYVKFKKAKLKISTLSILKNILDNHFINYFKNKNLNDLKAKEIQDYYLYIATLENNNRYKNLILTYVDGFLDWCDLMEVVSPSIVRKFKQILIKFTEIQKAKSDYLTHDELKYLVENTEDKTERLMYSILGFAGLRKGELLALQFKDIDFINDTIDVYKQKQYNSIQKKYIIVEYTKTNQNKRVDIPHWVSEYALELMQIKNATGDKYIFNYSIGLPNQLLERRLDKLNLKQVKIHDLRHSFTTMLYELGADGKYVAKQLGHSNEMTSRKVYEHLTEKQEQNNLKIIKLL
jgi:integrase